MAGRLSRRGPISPAASGRPGATRGDRTSRSPIRMRGRMGSRPPLPPIGIRWVTGLGATVSRMRFLASTPMRRIRVCQLPRATGQASACLRARSRVVRIPVHGLPQSVERTRGYLGMLGRRGIRAQGFPRIIGSSTGFPGVRHRMVMGISVREPPRSGGRTTGFPDVCSRVVRGIPMRRLPRNIGRTTGSRGAHSRAAIPVR